MNRKMLKITILIVISFGIAALGINQWCLRRNLASYKQTVEAMKRFADDMRNGDCAKALDRDAWGEKLSVTTNATQIVYVSRGVRTHDPSDDITLQIEPASMSYSISYSYCAHHYSSAATFE